MKLSIHPIFMGFIRTEYSVQQTLFTTYFQSLIQTSCVAAYLDGYSLNSAACHDPHLPSGMKKAPAISD